MFNLMQTNGLCVNNYSIGYSTPKMAISFRMIDVTTFECHNVTHLNTEMKVYQYLHSIKSRSFSFLLLSH